MARKGVKYIDKDKGWNRLKRELAKSRSKPHVVVGLFGAKGSEAHEDSPFTNAEVGSVHEYGLGNAPERSFIRDTVDIKGKNIAKTARRLANAVLGGLPTEAALELLGLYVKGEIQKRISDGIAPPNAPSTVRAKGSSTPLIDKGQLWGAIDHEVRRG